MKKTNQPDAKPTVLTVGNILIVCLSILSGLIHLLQPDMLLKLNGIGYLLLGLGAVVTVKGVEEFKEVAPKMLLAYALMTISMYFVFHGSSAVGHTVGLITKVVELWLVVVLFSGLRAQKKARAKAWAPRSRHHSIRRGASW